MKWVCRLVCLIGLGGVAMIGPSGDAAPSPMDSCANLGSRATKILTVPAGTAVKDRDDLPAVQHAIDAASATGGGVVTLSSGTYIINGHIVLKDNVKLTGAGPSTVIKAGSGFLAAPATSGGYPIITTNGASNTTIANLTADQSGDQLNGHVRGRLDGFLVEIRDSNDAVVQGVHTKNPFTYSLAVVASTNFCLEDSHTQVSTSGRYDQLDGIHVLDSNNGTVINNVVDQGLGRDGDDGLVAHSIGSAVHDVVFAHNRIRGGIGGSGMQIAVGDYPIFNLDVSENEFWGSPFGIRTGYYGTGAGSVYNVRIVGNNIHDLLPLRDSRGQAIEISHGRSSVPVSSIAVTGNRMCRAGAVSVAVGPHNVISGSTAC